MNSRDRYPFLLLSLAAIVCMLASVVISVQTSARALRQSERRQCESVAADVQAYRSASTLTEAGRSQLRSKENLLRLWGCPIPPEGK